jgi:hypothetical protein
MSKGPDACGWFFIGSSLARLHIDGAIEIVRENMPFKGNIIFQGDVLYLYANSRAWYGNSGSLYRIKNLFK